MPESTVIRITSQEMVISNRDVLLSTLLGSCVAICLHDGQETGAMCHALLPWYCPRHGSVSSLKEKLKYVDSSLELMLDRLGKRGIPPSRLSARIYGGADMFNVDRKGRVDVGRKNIEAARTLLDRYGIRVSAMNVGGNRGRKVAFNPGRGAVSLYLVPADKCLNTEGGL